MSPFSPGVVQLAHALQKQRALLLPLRTACGTEPALRVALRVRVLQAGGMPLVLELQAQRALLLGKPPVPGAARRMQVLQAGGMPLAPVLQAQRTLLLPPRPARGKAPLAYALQAQRTQPRPPGLDRPPAHGSARQAGRKAPTKESPIPPRLFSFSTAAARGTRTLAARTSSKSAPGCDDRIATTDGADHTATCIGTLPV